MKKSLLVAGAVIAAGLGILVFRPRADAAAAASVSSASAPSWQLKDLDGRTVTSEQFKGKVVVLDFWATWCPPCRQEIPGYVDLEHKYGKDGLAIVGVSLDQKGPDVVKKFVKTYQVDYPIVMGDETIVQAFGGIEAIPTTFLIDRDGTIRDRKVGRVETSEYEKRVLEVLKPSGPTI